MYAIGKKQRRYYIYSMCEIKIKVSCLHCQSTKVKKNGIKGTGKQNFYCKSCGKQFQLFYKNGGADPRKKALIRKMSVRGSGIRDINTVLEVSIYVVLKTLRDWFSVVDEPNLEGYYERVEIDEFWSWVGKRKKGKRWVWYAFCPKTKKILAFQIGKRNSQTCKKLMKKLAHLKIDSYCTDDWKAYRKLIPAGKHIVSKKKTTYIERQNLNFRTHLKRLARETLCSSKKDDMHYGLIKVYIHLKNAA